jgi:hypothetical protein
MFGGHSRGVEWNIISHSEQCHIVYHSHVNVLVGWLVGYLICWFYLVKGT